MSKKVSAARRALDYIRNAPRINERDAPSNPGTYTQGRLVSKRHNRAGKTMKELQSAARPPLGWIFGDWYSPWHRKHPSERHFNRDIHLRREYVPLSLLELQRLIDLGWIKPDLGPVDLTTLCGTNRIRVDPMIRQFGIQLTDVGADIFSAKINLEVQWASELSISTIERLGGTVTCAYFDPEALIAMTDCERFFESGKPVPKRLPPPADLIGFYADPAARGYLASEESVRLAKEHTAQKYGYCLPKIDENDEVMNLKKRKNQIFYGLEAGWLVNLADRCVLKPADEALKRYYAGDENESEESELKKVISGEGK